MASRAVWTILGHIGAVFAVQVTISNGPIVGRVAQTIAQNKTFYAFQGIPYASPPIGPLRFSAPVPPPNWAEPRNATDNGNVCMQIQGINDVQGSEDCLFINVYTPNLDQSSKLPVMVWIHGGYFLLGDANYEHYGPDYFLEQDVVVVTFNYRLGIFGFLSTEDESAPGNWAFKDQIMALRWVQDNIEVFGGDSGSVTLFGQSAGSASVSYLCQTPKTEGLFHRAIYQSGTSLNLWALSRKAKKAAFAVGTLLGIATTRSSVLISRLREVDAKKLYGTSVSENLGQTLLTNPRDGLVFAPAIEPDVEEAIVTGMSHQKLSGGKFHKIPYMIGFTSQEGIPMVNIINNLRLYLLTYDVFPSRLIPIDMNINPFDLISLTIVATTIKNYYLGFLPAVLSNTELTQYVTDDQFVRGIHETARLISSNASVFLYRFSYEGVLGDPSRTQPNQGVSHAEELRYLWRSQGSLQNPPENDILMRNKMVKIWTNFAKFSNPTPNADGLLGNVNWSTISPDNVKYMDIGETFQMSGDFYNYSIPFWASLYDRFGKPPYDTY